MVATAIMVAFTILPVLDYDLCPDCGAQLKKKEHMNAKNKRSQRHICPKNKHELGAQAAPVSNCENSMAGYDLSEVPPLDQTINDPEVMSVTSKFNNPGPTSSPDADATDAEQGKMTVGDELSKGIRRDPVFAAV